jgi:outer membrane protein assembly factor BamB
MLWNYTIGGYVWSSPAVVNGIVYVSSTDGKVYALNSTNGIQIWNYPINTSPYSSPNVVNGVLYEGSTDNNVYALNASNGLKLWNCTTVGILYSPAVDRGVVYVSSAGGTYALNASTGSKMWTFNNAAISSPTTANNIVYVSDVNSVDALDAATGIKVWNFTADLAPNEGFATANGILYFSGIFGAVYALNATTGAQIWLGTAGEQAFNAYYVPPAVANGILYVPHPSHQFLPPSDGPFSNAIYALDASTGAKIWTYDFGMAPAKSPAAIADGTVYISYSNSVLAIGTPTYQVTFATNGGGANSSTNPSGTQTYIGVQQIPITATPGAGYSFLSWIANPSTSFSFGDVNSANTTVTVNGSGTVTAIFTNTSNVPASISISANPSPISENPLQTSTLVATVLTKNGNPSQGINVIFTSTAGTISQPNVTDSNGQAQIILTPSSETTVPLAVTVTASAGIVQNYTVLTFEPPAYIFSISINPTSGTVSPGNSVATTVTVTSPPGTSQTVNIVGGGYPPNGNWANSPAGGGTPFSSTFTINTNGYTSGNPTPPGVYTIPIEAEHGGVVETANFTVAVIASNQATISAGNGGSVSYSYNGNSGSVQSGQSTNVQAIAGQQISLTAFPDSQHNFHNWITSGNVWVSDATSATTNLNVAGDGSVTASFNSYSVTIVSGTGGQVTYTSTSNSGTVNSGQQATIQMNYGSSLSLGALPATGYGYSFNSWTSQSTSIVIASQSSQSTTATINGYGIITATFQLQSTSSYTVWFYESGLQTGVQWTVIFDGQSYSSTSSSISIPNISSGQNPWSVSPPNGYTVSQSSGTLYISGNSVINL